MSNKESEAQLEAESKSKADVEEKGTDDKDQNQDQDQGLLKSQAQSVKIIDPDDAEPDSDKDFDRDFDDDDDVSRKQTMFDDDDYVDEPSAAKVDLSSWGSKKSVDSKGQQEEDDEEGSGEEEEGEGEDEDEYEDVETAVEEVVEQMKAEAEMFLGPIETPSEERIRIHEEHRREVARFKKDELINEYLTLMKRLVHLRKKNLVLTIKIGEFNDSRRETVERYTNKQLDLLAKIKEDQRLKKAVDECNKQISRQVRPKRIKTKKKKKNVRKTHFQDGEEMLEDAGESEEPVVLLKPKMPMTMGDVKNIYLDITKNAKTRKFKGYKLIRKCNKPEIKEPLPRKFSFHRANMLSDVIKEKEHHSRNTQLMNIRLSDELPDETPIEKESLTTGIAGYNKKRSDVFTGAHLKPNFHLTREARLLAQSKSRMALDKSNQTEGIMLSKPDVDIGDLHHFEFQFAQNPNLSGKNMSTKMREESLYILESRNVPTSQLKWPMEVKGFGYEGKNPFGRIIMNYTRLTHHEKEHPHAAYRVVLSNIAYFKSKQQRLTEVHQKNMFQMMEERRRLTKVVDQVLLDLFKGLRICATLAGITCREKRIAKLETEIFIEDLQETITFLIDLFTHMYKAIQANELALRRLAVSEGKGEGAQLSEFKEMMRSREKLKAQHKSVQKFIVRYQNHSKGVLKTLQNTDRKMHLIMKARSTMRQQNSHLKKMIEHVAEGLHYCHGMYRHRKQQLINANRDMGILAFPSLMADCQRINYTREDFRMRKYQLTREYKGVVKQIHELQPRSAFYGSKRELKKISF